ncbi:MAG: hypothetical protein GTN40_03610 [Candidatus Aenigmarchaeota archaeon]|nr:hypothetical protein [Candidatus Aenigmarchaeota archaeon]
MVAKIALIILIVVEQFSIFSSIRPKVADFLKNYNFYKEEIVVVQNPESQSSKNEFILEIPSLPQKSPHYTEMSIQANSSLVVDKKIGNILFSKNENQPLKIASLTKIMTAIVVLKNSSLDQVVTVSGLYPLPEDNMGITNGEQIKVEDLLHGLLIGSANDAAVALAIWLAGSVEGFVEMMNNEAKNLDLDNTNFTNPTGFDYPDGGYSTVHDLAKLVRFALNNEKFREIVGKQFYIAESVDKNIIHSISTTNWLLDNQLVFGVKTGKTAGAGECLIALAKSNKNEIIAIVLKSPDRFGETRKLINWTFNSYQW